MIIRRQESAQEPCGSWRLCSLPRRHPGHRQEYVRTNGPWIADSGSSWCREAAGDSPPIPHQRRIPLAGFVRCRLSRVSDTRSERLNQEDSING